MDYRNLKRIKSNNSMYSDPFENQFMTIFNIKLNIEEMLFKMDYKKRYIIL